MATIAPKKTETALVAPSCVMFCFSFSLLQLSVRPFLLLVSHLCCMCLCIYLVFFFLGFVTEISSFACLESHISVLVRLIHVKFMFFCCYVMQTKKLAVEGFVNEEGSFEFNHLRDEEPVEFLEDRDDVVVGQV